MSFLRFLRRMLREQRARFVTIVLLMALVALTEGLIIMLIVPLLNVVMEVGSRPEGILGQATALLDNILHSLHLELTLGIILAIIVAIFIIQGLFRLLQMHLQMRMLTDYESSLIHDLFGGFLSSSWSFFLRNKIGQLMNVLSQETSRATSAFQFSYQFVASFLVAIFYIVIAFFISWPITLGGIVLSALASLLLKRLMRQAEKYGVETSEANNQLQAYAFDKLSAAKMLKASATGQRALEGMSSIIKQKVRLRYLSIMNATAIRSFYEPLVMAILALIGYFAVTWWGSQVALILVFVFIFYRLVPHFSTMQAAYQQVLIFMPGLEEVDKLKRQIKSLPDTGGNIKFVSLREGIVFDKVSFAYDGQSFVLKDIDMRIIRGESVAIVGESGVGKTTLVDLLLGLLTPTKGQILIDGIPITDYDLTSWRKAIGYMSQDIFLFHDTVEANLKWTAPDTPDETVKAAANVAYASEFLNEMPEGYSTVIGDRGVKLSVGQRQRLALARTVIQHPEIVVLDEATSSLDSESEAMIQQAINKTWTGKTVITIAHRLSTVRDTDRIYVLENGGIAESGTWAELVARKGRFEQMRAMQNL